MVNVAKKAMVLGIDCPIVLRMINWAKQGKLPTLKKMLERGTFAPNCLVPFPYQALEDPDATLKELQSLRRNVERLKRMVERPPMC